ncbi:hypothetical protein BD779DRAFT_1174653 [Infundibulicybe gibba]|nr:hypothetical protein BD779DRAFT_1174653 [Infundibulicybe gibba]
MYSSYERESTFSHPPSPETASGTSISSGSLVDHAITYSFSQSSPNSMVVIPTDYPDAHPPTIYRSRLIASSPSRILPQSGGEERRRGTLSEILSEPEAIILDYI